MAARAGVPGLGKGKRGGGEYAAGQLPVTSWFHGAGPSTTMRKRSEAAENMGADAAYL
jgi:hypothetical protein